jgi:cold shock CspA family protein
MSHTGIVKWFNNKTGYGFIKSGEEDIFVHHQQLKVQNNMYKYLVQGEYVQFDSKLLTEGKHKCMAVLVTGINGGPLMCETRQAMKDSYEANNSAATSS